MKKSLIVILMLAACSAPPSEPAPTPVTTTPPPPAPAIAPPKRAPEPPPQMQQPPQEVPPPPVMSESVPPIAAQTDTAPMAVLSTTEQDLWANFAGALAERNVSLTEPAMRLLRAYVHRAAETPGTSANMAQAESNLALLADELQKEGGQDVVDDRKVSAALKRWCPRAPFC